MKRALGEELHAYVGSCCLAFNNVNRRGERVLHAGFGENWGL